MAPEWLVFLPGSAQAWAWAAPELALAGFEVEESRKGIPPFRDETQAQNNRSVHTRPTDQESISFGDETTDCEDQLRYPVQGSSLDLFAGALSPYLRF